MDVEKFLDRFGQENIRFELKQDDTAMQQMMPITAITGGYSGTAPMIEILVHPDDEARAAEIVGADIRV